MIHEEQDDFPQLLLKLLIWKELLWKFVMELYLVYYQIYTLKLYYEALSDYFKVDLGDDDYIILQNILMPLKTIS